MLAQGAPDAGPLIVPPTAKCEGAPEYPPSERGSGIETDVVVQITLAADGGVTKREVPSAPSSAFAAAAERATTQCTLTPATVNGVPAPSRVDLTIHFTPPVQPWTLEGEVVGELGEALAGAVVSLADRETRTDASGKFSLTLDALPHMGRHDDLHYCLGCNGSGIAMMTYLGWQTARKIARAANYACLGTAPPRPTPARRTRSKSTPPPPAKESCSGSTSLRAAIPSRMTRLPPMPRARSQTPTCWSSANPASVNPPCSSA